MILGGLIGWERERNERPAGLRTHILVCVGSALITIVSNIYPQTGGRVAAQIVTGIGFLGAGTIIRSGSDSQIRGLTTAATIWVCAGIGIAIGYERIYACLAAVGTGIVLFTLIVLTRLDGWLVRHRIHHRITLLFESDGRPLQELRVLIDQMDHAKVKAHQLSITNVPNGAVVQMMLTIPRGIGTRDVAKLWAHNPSVIHHEWIE